MLKSAPSSFPAPSLASTVLDGLPGHYIRRLQQIAVAAEIDSALLADALPPTAYGDPGFSEFLLSGEAP